MGIPIGLCTTLSSLGIKEMGQKRVVRVEGPTTGRASIQNGFSSWRQMDGHGYRKGLLLTEAERWLCEKPRLKLQA